MKLRQLLQRALGLDWQGTDPDITAVVQDHRRASPGALFVARAGARHDGRALVPDAAALGAVAVVAEPSELLRDSPLPVITVADAEAVTGQLAAELLGRPSQRLQVIGVTGTDGKTSTSFLLRHLLMHQAQTALISTAEVHDGVRQLPTEGHFTTPEAPEVQAMLDAAVRAGSSTVVLESSSHALDRHRLAGVDFDLAVWTNLTREHLDWHGTMDNYLRAKRSLVERAGRAVLNLDDQHYSAFREAATDATSYGLTADADWQAVDIRESAGGLSFAIRHQGRTHPVQLPLIGSFNVHNALAAVAAAARMGMAAGEAAELLGSFKGVPGRMQLLQSTPFSVVVDFAHTGPALVKALAALRRLTSGRIILVVGAAGERDPGKRQPLAQAAAEAADLVVFTEEDSRSEHTRNIVSELETYALQAGAHRNQVLIEEDRREAIRLALGRAEPGDLVLLAGKGVEQTLERESETIPWDEAATARELLDPLHGDL